MRQSRLPLERTKVDHVRMLTFASIIAGFGRSRRSPCVRCRVAPWLRRTPPACGPARHLTPAAARASRCASRRPAALAPWRSSPRRRTPPASAWRRCSPRASCWPRPCCGRSSPCARGARTGAAQAGAVSGAHPPRRRRRARARRDRLRRPGGPVLLRAAPHRRVADVAAALHVPGARVLRGRRAAPRARDARKALALALASAGAALVLLGGGTGGLEASGVALALGAGAMYAGYILVADGIVRAHRRVPARRAHHDGRGGDVPGRGRRRRRADVPGRRLALDRRDRALLHRPARSWRSCSAWSGWAPRRRRSCRRSSRSSRSASRSRSTREALGPLQVVGGALVLAAVVALQATATRGRARR